MKQVEIIGVVGAGTMGMGICEVAAANGMQVLVFDVNTEFAEESFEAMKNRLKKRVIKGKISESQAASTTAAIKVVNSLKALMPCDLVVEAIVEKIDVKIQLFQELEDIVSESTLLATNTSSISITAIAAGMSDASRLFGLHFFNPAPVMKLVEIISGLSTDKNHLETAKKLCQSWNKVPVMAQSTPGFIVNRVARSFYGESMKLLQEQLADINHIDAVLTECAGFRMGPFTLMDLIGIDINFAVSHSVYNAFFGDPRFRPSLLQGEMVQANRLGRKTGRGFYDYAEGSKNTKPAYQESDVTVDKLVVPEHENNFSALFSHFDCDFRLWEGDKVIIDGCQILPCAGLTATQIESDTNFPTCLVDLSFDHQRCKCVNLAFGPAVNNYMKSRIVSVLNQAGKQVLFTPDQPGMISMRVIAMLINEAADTVFNGVCSAKDVDLAMQYGVNYPKGLLAFGEELGWHHVAQTLEKLQHWFGDDRYRLSPYIRNLI